MLVYAMADRLLILDVKNSLARLMVMSLSRFTPKGREKLFLADSSLNAEEISFHVSSSSKANGTPQPTWVNEKISAIDGACMTQILRILYLTTNSSGNLKGVVVQFASQYAVLKELSCCLEFGELMRECEELRLEILKAARHGETIEPQELRGYASKQSL